MPQGEEDHAFVRALDQEVRLLRLDRAGGHERPRPLLFALRALVMTRASWAVLVAMLLTVIALAREAPGAVAMSGVVWGLIAVALAIEDKGK
jgi:hypothetical protein